MKIRGFTVVLHDVHKGIQAKADVENKIKTMPFRQYVIAEEPYNHQEGSHIHIFIQLKNPIHFTSALKFWCTWWKSGPFHGVPLARGHYSPAGMKVQADKKGAIH